MTRPAVTMRTKQRVQAIQQMIGDGMRPPHIAAVLRISTTRVRTIAKRFLIPLPRANARRFGVVLGERHARVILSLAQKAGVPASEVVSRIARAVVCDGEAHAARFLGKEVKPPRVRKRRSA